MQPSDTNRQTSPYVAVGWAVCILAFWAWSAGIGRAPHQIAVLAVRTAIVLPVLCLHEWAHAVAAFLLGDTTARDRGRMTLNPRAHFDPVGLLLVPGLLAAAGSPLLVGWAKPVPLVYARLRWPRSGLAIVSAAGPVSNLVAAILIAIVLRLCGINGVENLATSIIWTLAVTSLAVGLFNLLPIYPMDGGRILSSLLPNAGRDWLLRNERQSSQILTVVLLLIPVMVASGNGSFLTPLITVSARAAALLTGSAGAAWYGPLHAWSVGR